MITTYVVLAGAGLLVGFQPLRVVSRSRLVDHELVVLLVLGRLEVELLLLVLLLDDFDDEPPPGPAAAHAGRSSQAMTTNAVTTKATTARTWMVLRMTLLQFGRGMSTCWPRAYAAPRAARFLAHW